METMTQERGMHWWVADKNGIVTDPVGFHSTGADGPHEGWFAACVAWAMDVAQPARTVIWKQCELRPTDSEDGPGTVVPPDPFYADQSYRT